MLVKKKHCLRHDYLQSFISNLFKKSKAKCHGGRKRFKFCSPCVPSAHFLSSKPNNVPSAGQVLPIAISQ